MDDEDWLLDTDEVQEELDNTGSPENGHFDEDRMLRTVVQRHPPPPGGPEL